MTTFDERLVINQANLEKIIYDEHLVRYHLAGQLVENKIVLDVACGSGYGSNILAKAKAKEVLGLDIDQEAVAKAKKEYNLPNLRFGVDSAEELASLADNSVELITSFETIEHLNNYQAYLKALARVLTADGLALISTPNLEVFGQKNPFHVKEFTKQELQTALAKHFKYIEILEQRNALASFIVGNKPGSPVMLANKQAPVLYYIALCSNSPLNNVELPSVASLNTKALEQWQNNLGWRVVNRLYSFLVNLKLIKRT